MVCFQNRIKIFGGLISLFIGLPITSRNFVRVRTTHKMTSNMSSHISTFSLRRPERQKLPILASSPHSGRLYPPDFRKLARIPVEGLRLSEDRFVDLLVEDVSALGVPVLTASLPRSFVDLNRSPLDLDPELISGISTAFTQVPVTPRARQGLGVVPRVAANGAEIYDGVLSIADARRRLLRYYFPYHKMLRSLIATTCASFGFAVLLDFHSMPARSVNINSAPRTIVLGNGFGSSAPAELIARAREIFLNLGYQVFENQPYSGGFITRHYGQVERGVFALQVEISRAAYMDEKTLQPRNELYDVRADMVQFVAELAKVPKLLQVTE